MRGFLNAGSFDGFVVTALTKMSDYHFTSVDGVNCSGCRETPITWLNVWHDMTTSFHASPHSHSRFFYFSRRGELLARCCSLTKLDSNEPGLILEAASFPCLTCRSFWDGTGWNCFLKCFKSNSVLKSVDKKWFIRQFSSVFQINCNSFN